MKLNLQRWWKILTFGWSREGESGSYVVCGWVGRLSEVAMEKRLKGDISLSSSAAHDVRKKSHASGETQKPGLLFDPLTPLSFCTSIHFESLLQNRVGNQNQSEAIHTELKARQLSYMFLQTFTNAKHQCIRVEESSYRSDKVRVIRS